MVVVTCLEATRSGWTVVRKMLARLYFFFSRQHFSCSFFGEQMVILGWIVSGAFQTSRRWSWMLLEINLWQRSSSPFSLLFFFPTSSFFSSFLSAPTSSPPFLFSTHEVGAFNHFWSLTYSPPKSSPTLLMPCYFHFLINSSKYYGAAWTKSLTVGE